MTTDAGERIAAMAKGRRADSERCRQRVLNALADAAAAGDEISISGIARRAGVDRTFLYRHSELLERLRALEAQPLDGPGAAPAITRASLQADLFTAQHRAASFASRIQHLERRLSELLGQQAWRDSGLGAPDDIDQLQQRISSLEAQLADMKIQLDERDDELAAARLTNREMMVSLNASAPST